VKEISVFAIIDDFAAEFETQESAQQNAVEYHESDMDFIINSIHRLRLPSEIPFAQCVQAEVIRKN
jgi:hypothetical protein